MDTITVYDFFAPMWVELSFFVFFALGFLFLRLDAILKLSKVKRKRENANGELKLQKTIETEVSGGQHKAAIQSWRAACSRGPTQTDLLRLVVEAFCVAEPDSLGEIVDHLAMHRSNLANSRMADAVLDVIARAGQTSAMEEIASLFQSKLGIPRSSTTYEVLLGGFASVGAEQKVKEIRAEMEVAGVRISARGHSLVIKGFLKNNMALASSQEIVEMHTSGFLVPSFAVTQLTRVACDNGNVSEIFESLKANGFFGKTSSKPKNHTALSAEAAQYLLEGCLRRSDVKLAHSIEEVLRKSNVKFNAAIFDPLLKTYAVARDMQAFTIFEEMKVSGIPITEGLIVGAIARCAESNPKFLDFAEEVAKFAKSKGKKTLLVYSALMKVYAHSGLFDKACDLYEQLTADGLEPDSVMYGCLMKFAAECGRTDLSRRLADKAPSLDIQNYMSLIRAAGRDGDVEQAFAILKRLNASGVKLDAAAHNCVLDVCASCGAMSRARALAKDMLRDGTADVITFNTVIKGYCKQGDLFAARSVLTEMKSVNITPNDISYNLYLNAAIRTDFEEAWKVLELVERKGMVDHYTISILMKELKKTKVKNAENFRRAFAIFERANLDVCSDEILLSTVIEACMWFRDVPKLEKLVAAFRTSKLRPAISVYGALIKAASMMRRVDICRELWEQAVEERSMTPTDITLGCMLDALVTNNCVNEAVGFFNSWKGIVKPNTVMYSTLAKGFANTRQPARAMDLWRDIRSQQIRMNTVTCNAIIDAQARSGMMDEVLEIVAVMEQEGCLPDVITFSTVIKGYCIKGDVDRAFDVFRTTQKNGFVTDSVIYNTLLDGCLRHNRPELADKLVEEMEVRCIAPSNFTLGILVRMYGRRRQVERAFEVTESLAKRHGIKVNTEVKTCLIAACINNHAIDRALQLFADLRESQADLDSKIYGTLISGCIRFGRLPEAVRLVEDAYGLQDGSGPRGLRRGESLEKDFLDQIFHSLKKNRMMDDFGSPLLEKLRAAKVPAAAQLILSALGGEGTRSEGKRRQTQ